MRFVAAAVRARRVATRNPVGLFVSLVRRRLWHYASMQDEDSARRLLSGTCAGGRVEPCTASASVSPEPMESLGTVLNRMLNRKRTPGSGNLLIPMNL